MVELVLGPMLRHVNDTTGAVWVETSAACQVTVTAGEHRAQTPTFMVHGHHYALVCVEGLSPGSKYTYQVQLDDVKVWPLAGMPPSVIATLDPAKPLRLAFGSCRTSVPHDAEGLRTHGVDALRAYALRMAGLTDATHPESPDPGGVRWPDLVLFLGDQVYADHHMPEAMQDFIRSRRDIEQPPWTELKDYEEYTQLYRLAWTDPVNRWLLSTIPSAMIFDDHDIRDDWNTSHSWREQMAETSWWHGRIVAGLASYWVYQHLGNLTPAERAEDEVWRLIARTPQEVDLGPTLDAFADRVDREPDTYRWSYVRDFGTQARLIVVDSRAARVLEPTSRSILDEQEFAWFDAQMRGDVDHLLIGTSLPFLLAPGLHHLEAFDEALAEGVWGRWGARLGESVRQAVDLEHWAAFQHSFAEVARLVLEVARGRRGRAPRSVTFLSGDVHHSYISEAFPARRATRGEHRVRSRILQAVCSPIRNPLPRAVRAATAALSYAIARPVGRAMSWAVGLPPPSLTWGLAHGPWFQNNLATLEITPDGLRIWWATGVIGDDPDRPALHRVADVALDCP